MILAGATYDRVMTRYGAARARKEFRPLRYGSDITRPGEQVAFDDHECDLSVWLRYYKVFDDLTPGMQKIAETSRVWITVGVDVATGWVVSIKMSKRRSSRMVINAIEMAISDKSHLARMCGATMPWPAFPIDGFISDNGTEYTADEVTEKLSACEIERDRTPAEQPWLRGTCERTLRTLGEITLHGLPGKTFSNVVEKGDYSPEQNAALLAEQFYALLVRMVVDYHHLKISGPRRAAPYNAVIDYLNETRPGARKVSDPHMRRHIFGVNMKRVIHPEGIIVWGIRYNSDQLQSLRHMIGNERVRIHFHREDIRWISVQLKDRTWITVKNRFCFAEPIGLLEWIQARKDVIADATIKQKDNLPAMWEALRYRREVGDSAALSAGLTLHQPSDEDIRHSHKIMFEGADFSTERRQLTPLPALFFDKDHFLEGGFRAVKPSDLNPKAASKAKADAKPASPAGDKPKPEPSYTAKKDKDYAAF
jgi:transposase InsO family protein